MLETKILLLEDRPDRIVIKQSYQPWRWGGFTFSIFQIALILAFPLILVLKGSRKITVDTAFRNINIKNSGVLSREQKQIHFSEVDNVTLSSRTTTVATDRNIIANPDTINIPIPMSLVELSFLLSNQSKVKILTGYRNNQNLSDIGNKLSTIMNKPLIEDSPKQTSNY